MMAIRWFASGAVTLGCLGIWIQQPGQQDQQQPPTPPAAIAATSPLAPAAPVAGSQYRAAIRANGQAFQAAEPNSTPGSNIVYGLNPYSADGIHVVYAGQQRIEMQNLLIQYRDAKTGSEERSAAREEISKALSEQYDAFVVQQETQIKEMEDRLAKLREQLQRRREAKSRMVELKLEMVLSQADGLGWPDGGGDGFFGQTMGFPMPTPVPAGVPFIQNAPLAPTAK